MSAVASPFGFIPTLLDDDSFSRDYSIAATAGKIYKNQPVVLQTDGTIAAAAANQDLLGVFLGCEYVDGNGRPQVSNFWPADTNATNIVAYVCDDFDQEYLVQADGSVAQTAIGDQADITNAGNNGLGLSQATLSATLKGAAAQGQFRILAIPRDPDNIAGDAFTKLRVKIARHQYMASKVAI